MRFEIGWAVLIGLLLVPLPARSSEVANIPITDYAKQQICPGNSHRLVLNGAGIRKRWIFEIYVGALYLTERMASAEAIIDSASPKRLTIHVLYSKISQEMLVENWKKGIVANHTPAEIAGLETRLNFAFDTFFTDTFRGDEIVIDYAPCVGTVVTVNGERRGTVPGEDFYQALLKIWIGQNPADASLKKAMLGLN